MPEHTQKTYLLAEKHRISSADGSLRHHGVYPGWQIGEKGCEKMLQEGNKQAPVWCKVFVSALAELSELVRLQREWVVSQKVRERGSPALCGLLQDFLTSGTRQFCIYPRYSAFPLC
ncbi:hypothetical protein DIPPA_13334 [Diplonema papillatum]|nr:hypothetical protein DIPPA_13334 [Diplonema papillatum]